MFKRALGVIFLAAMPYTGQSGLPDPTRPAYPVNPQTSAVIPDGEPKLSAIWIYPRSRWATINGIRAKQGKTIPGNIRILEIHKNTVTINQNGTIKTLQLLQRPYQTQ